MICRRSGGFVSQQNADAARSGGGDGPGAGADGSNDSTSNCATLARTGKGGGRRVRRVRLVVVLNNGVDVADGRMY